MKYARSFPINNYLQEQQNNLIVRRVFRSKTFKILTSNIIFAMAYNGALGAGGCIPTTPNSVAATLVAAATPPMIDGPQNKKIRTGGQPTDQTDIHQNRVSFGFVVVHFFGKNRFDSL